MLSFFRKKSVSDVVDGIIPPVAAAVIMQQQSNKESTPPSSVAAAEEALDSNDLVRKLGYTSLNDLKETIYGECAVWSALIIARNFNHFYHRRADILRTIRDPEKPSTLEDLNVVYEEGIFVQNPTSDNVNVVSTKRRRHIYEVLFTYRATLSLLHQICIAC